VKLKWIYLLGIALVCFGFLSTILVDIGTSQDDFYNISLSDMRYEITRTEILQNQEVVYYNIYITLSNLGTIDSDDITLEIVGDDGLPLYDHDVIPAGGSRVFSWEDPHFVFIGAIDHYINISYYPTDLSISRTEQNLGEDYLILEYNDNRDGNTPGFEFILLIMTLIMYIGINNYKN